MVQGPKPVTDAPSSGWSTADAEQLYGVDAWGKGYFAVNPSGHMEVRPEGCPGRSIDLYEVVLGLDERGITTPVLLRFTDLLGSRLNALHEAFSTAIKDHDYRGGYACVYPIKVNQQRHVVEQVQRFGSAFGFGLEVGSKPELLAVLGMTTGDDDLPIVCNGFKDGEFIETVVLAAKLGRNIIPVVEKLAELDLLVKHADRYGVRPTIGMRVKLSARGAGRWEDSGGLRSKFGLHVSEALSALDELRSRGMADCLQLLHCHIGSQVFDIRNIKMAVSELAHIYTELHRLGAGLRYLDVGGGLGVDYDGSLSNQDSSINYTLAEYAGDVVYRIAEICDDAGVPHPFILSESGRAVAAYHSVLVFDVLGATGFDAFEVPPSIEEAAGDADPADFSQPLWDLYGAYDLVRDEPEGHLEEAYHDAVQAHEEAMNLFRLGYMSLTDRSLAEKLYWTVCSSLLKLIPRSDDVPEELELLVAQMSDIYFCNLSIFQSLPDSWAIGQLFPIAPIHRLEEAPSRRAVLADVTCDSEGRIDRFASGSEPTGVLELHRLREGEPYYLGAFLVGAYQETLGDLHNLFGDTHAVHVGLADDGHWEIQEYVPGDTVREVLSYVQHDPDRLLESMRRDVENAVRRDRLTVREGRQLLRFYRQGLDGYTYLEEG